MAVVHSPACSRSPFFSGSYSSTLNSSPLLKFPKNIKVHHHRLRLPNLFSSSYSAHNIKPRLSPICNTMEPDQEEHVQTVGVKAAISMLKFYKREISPLMPKSCRYVPSCSEYSMIAYKKYGVFKGTVLTAWRLCRCNPLGGSGFDPPRWFDEERVPEE
ncbi:UPF0161 protein At3g09310 isoform X1 [Beta vulgaris subsp. vulgaris]|uniref:UPF0161 protein At3g09310 isoform X1 n=2 Tax=Beta vulgaris subsp. vulgaris TaxID=3555 RepID=UPI0020373F3C|nr:UPF0161 protein At3g09310 isoform X1 [Beta vulgaris subsp. vulgaris]